MKNDKLKKYRKEIDKIDRTIMLAYIKRKQIVEKIAKYKKENNIVIYDKKREKEIIDKITSISRDNYEKKVLKQIYNIILIKSKEEQKKCSKRSPREDNAYHLTGR